MFWERDKPDGRPCRMMDTRACPDGRDAGCPGEPCARFELPDGPEAEQVWAATLARDERERQDREAEQERIWDARIRTYEEIVERRYAT
jgi:hypothetical protein